MKSQFILSAFFIFSWCLISNPTHANHAAGGSLTYMHVTGNQYTIRATFFRECAGDAAPGTITVYINSVLCGITDSVILDPLPGTGQEVTINCPSHPSTCNGGTDPGIQKWEYESTYSFPGQCADWILYASIASRNADITTIQNPSSGAMYLEARLNNLSTDNSTPLYSNPFFVLCTYQNFAYNPGMIDMDGDSLVYELIPARIDANTNVSFNGSYSAYQFVSSPSLPFLDPTTGDLVLDANAIETGVLVYRVVEYRNGVLIGSMMLEMDIYTTACSFGFNQYLVEPTNFSHSIYPGPFCLDFITAVNDSTDTLTMTFNLTGTPGATFTFTGGGQAPSAVFCWNPDSSDIRPQPYTFFVTLIDNHCPSNGAQVYSFSITVGHPPTQFSGNVFFDFNQNGIKDTLEIDLPDQRIVLNPDNENTFTEADGNFTISSFLGGPQTLTIIPDIHWVITTDSLSYTLPDDSLHYTGLVFGLAPDTSFNDLEVHLLSGNPTCNSVENYYLVYTNEGTNIIDGRVALVIDSNTSFVSSVPPPDLISADTLFFNFTGLWPYQTGQILISLNLPGAGTPLEFISLGQLDSTGTYIELYLVTNNQVVACSFDPNDKAVSPEGIYADHRVLYTDPLQYTIRFQNTGNDTAFTVYVLDEIDPSLDIQTLQVTGSSHPMTTTIFSDRTVEVRFLNILLPDSNVDEPGSNGFIRYEILPLQNLSLPVEVENTASIYFDSNPPVVTNTVWNTLVSDLYVSTSPVKASTETITVVPNPFSNTARLILSKSFINTETAFTLTDAMGRTVVHKMIKGYELVLMKGNLYPGIYFFELRNQLGNRATGRIVIE